MTLCDRLRANAALLDHITRTGQRLTAPHKRALVADLLQMAVEAQVLERAAAEVSIAESYYRTRRAA
jgi:hypothetical protein